MTFLRSCKISSFNCKGFKYRNYSYLQHVFNNVDFLLLQELWLYEFEFDIIGKVLPHSSYIAKSSMKSDYFSVTSIDTESDRLCACKVQSSDIDFVLLNVYMPTNNNNNMIYFWMYCEIVSICLMYLI